MTHPSPEEIIALLHEYPVTEIEFEQDGYRIKAAVAQHHAAHHTHFDAQSPPDGKQAQGIEAAAAIDTPVLITADVVGHFHLPSPPLRYGTQIQVEQIVGNIESIKVMNEVVSPVAGKLAETLVDDGAAVEYGQPLYRLVPS